MTDDEIIDEEIEQTKAEISRDIHDEISSMLKKAFKGNKYIRIK